LVADRVGWVAGKYNKASRSVAKANRLARSEANKTKVFKKASQYYIFTLNFMF
jgi:hypothetical protein